MKGRLARAMLDQPAYNAVLDLKTDHLRQFTDAGGPCVAAKELKALP